MGAGPHPCAVIGHGAAAGQAGVEVGDAVGAADRSVLMNPTATVHITASRQVPLSQSHAGAAGRQRVRRGGVRRVEGETGRG